MSDRRHTRRPLTERVEAAISYLTAHGQRAHAQAVTELMLAAEGAGRNLAFKVHPDSWAQAQAAPEQVTTILDSGFAAFLRGQFRPERPKRLSGGRKVMNTRLSDGRREQLEAFAQGHSDALGWTPSPSQVAAAWIEHRFPPRPS